MSNRAARALRARLTPPPGEVPDTQAELAERLGVTRQAVANWLSGQCLPSSKNMAEMERLYGIPMLEWLEESHVDS